MDYCPNCGYKSVAETYRFCPQCGQAIQKRDRPAAQVSVAQEIGRIEGAGQATALSIGSASGPLNIGTINQIIGTFEQRSLTAVEKARQRRDFEAEILAEGVQDHVHGLQEGARKAVASIGKTPYRGLLEYRLDDARSFFGRDQAIEELLQCMDRDPLAILYAESGAGKTSLLQAGVTPHLIQLGHLPMRVRTLKMNPAIAVKQAFLSTTVKTPGLSRAPLRAFMHQVADMFDWDTQIFVFLDQFEEFFLYIDEPTRRKFVAELAQCLADGQLRVRWVISLRREYFGSLAEFSPEIKQAHHNSCYLGRLTRAKAEEAVVRPAALHGIAFDRAVVDALLDELDKGGITPAHIQLVCQALYKGLKHGETTITMRLLESQLGVSGILSNYLNRVLTQDLKPKQRSVARHILEALITHDGQRAQCTQDELVRELTAQGSYSPQMDQVLNQLLESRLLRIVEIGEYKEAKAYELAHEYLLQEIEVDPLTKARKAAQELLKRETESYQHHKTLVSAEKLGILELQNEYLAPDVTALDLLFRSALRSNHPVVAWRKSAVRLGEAAALAKRWIQLLTSADEAEANTAIALLASLPEEGTVAQLLELARSESAPDENPLQNDSIVKRRVLQTLAHIESEAAESYLRKLEVEGYCFVPAGRFPMGSGERPDEQPVGLVQVPAFWIARFPVTVGEWRQFVEAGGYVEDRYWAGLDKEKRRQRPLPTEWKIEKNKEDHPVRNVTWYEAMAYAAWKAEMSGWPVALPTEAEWEKAASWDRQASKSRRYPWGDAADMKCCNSRETDLGETTPIGTYVGKGDSPWEAQDMAGNVLEWTRTKHNPYPYQIDDGRESIFGDEARVLRGGSFERDISDARCARRYQLNPALGLDSTGCRMCLRLVPLKGQEQPFPASGPGAG